MASRIPPLLEPYLDLPPETSLVVLTGVLGAGTNWLTQRYLCSFLGAPKRGVGAEGGTGQHDGDRNGEMSVVLVSFMRDYAFWKENVGRHGIDLDAQSKRHRFCFVDGLSELFAGAPGGAAQATAGAATAVGRRTLRGATLPDLRKELYQVFAEHPGGNVVLILDNPDLLLAASGYTITGEALRATILDIREKVHSTIVTLAADEPLISAQATTLEKDHAAFTLSLAHEAEMVIGLRLLDTGTARDVSGVLRVTHGGGATGFVQDERELLYFVGGDGGVRVFERGQ